MDLDPFYLRLLLMSLGLGLNQYWVRPNFNLGASNCPPHTLWPEGHIVCIKVSKKKTNLKPIFNMRPKVSSLPMMCWDPTPSIICLGVEEDLKKF